MANEWICSRLAKGVAQSECAAWVQAWGSIAAILVAVGVAWWQFYSSRLMARRARREKALVMIEAIGAFLSIYADELRSIDGALDNVDSQAVATFLTKIKPETLFLSVERSIHAIPLHDLPDRGSVSLVVALMNQIRTDRDTLTRLKGFTAEGHLPFISTVLKNHIDALGELGRQHLAAKDRAYRLA